MDTTVDHDDRLERVEALLAEVRDADPAEAVAPLQEVADLLEGLLDAETAR